jgi:hypothetical protein
MHGWPAAGSAAAEAESSAAAVESTLYFRVTLLTGYDRWWMTVSAMSMEILSP